MQARSEVRWAILGTGFIANAFAQGLNFVTGSKLIAVGSRTKQRAQEFCKRHNVATAYANYGDLLADKDIDIIYVATPAALHKEHCIWALEGGKAVLCEKPFALDADQAKTIVNVARKKGLFCMEAMWMRFIPLMTRVFKMIQNGAIGEVRTVIASFGSPHIYDPDDSRFNASLGGGAMLDLGIYPISLANWLLGEPKSAISSATMTGSGVDEESAAILDYCNGGRAIISANLRHQLSNDAFIVGTHGNIYIHAPIYRPHKMTYTQTVRPQHSKSMPISNTFLSKLRQFPIAQRTLIWMDGLVGAVLKDSERASVVSFNGNGYNYEAEAAATHLRSGSKECAVMPLDDTIRTLVCIDIIKKQWN